MLLQPVLNEKNIVSLLIFLLRPHQESKLVHFICQWSHISHDDQRKKWFNPLFAPDLSPRRLHLDLRSFFSGITWSLASSASCSNRLTAFLLTWLCIITNLRQLPRLPEEFPPAAQQPNQLRNLGFHRKKLSRKSERCKCVQSYSIL